MSTRRVIPTRSAEFGPYDMEGPQHSNIALLCLSYDRGTREGSYLMRMQPGARTVAHTHACREEYIILEGSLIESDGTVLTAGDYVIYEPGSRHHSRTEEGCLLLAIDWQPSEVPRTPGGEKG